MKLIVFDLDGVLVSTKDLHYKALNEALVRHGRKPIPYEDHLDRFDGLPTAVKLRTWLGEIGDVLDLREAEAINGTKQRITAEMLEEGLGPDAAKQELFRRLKEAGFAIHVASNSVRYTCELVLFKLGLMRYVDHVVSNEDVRERKPRPEMYLRCMVRAGVGPRETLVVEDSYVGRQGAFNSGAHVLGVNSPAEVTWEAIERAVNRAEGVKPTWKDDRLNVLVPAAGAGSRFAKAGYTFPKPLIEVGSSRKPMIQAVVDNLAMDAHFVFIVQREHNERYGMSKMLEAIAPGCDVVEADGLTEGAACTTLLARDVIDSDRQLVIANSDQFLEWDSSDFMYAMQAEAVDAGIVCFRSSHPKWSYVRTDDRGMVVEVREKEVISDMATVGVYYFKRGSDYVAAADRMIAADERFNGEFYVAPTFNQAIAAGLRVKPYFIEGMHGMGTPEDLDHFNKTDLL